MNNYSNVTELRKAYGMSQSQFAKYFGIPINTIHNWDQGLRKPPEYVFKMMVEILEKRGVIDDRRIE